MHAHVHVHVVKTMHVLTADSLCVDMRRKVMKTRLWRLASTSRPRRETGGVASWGRGPWCRYESSSLWRDVS